MRTPTAGSSAPRPTWRPAALALLACLGTLAAPAGAQDHLFSVTGYLGSAAYGNLAAGEDPGVMLEPGGFYGAQAELWLGRFGARLHTGFASTSLVETPGPGFDIVAIDADFLARLRRPRPGQFFQPYGVLGFGVVRYTTGTDATTVAGYDYGRDPENRASMVLGIGADFGGGPAALRLELMDIIGFASPLQQTDGSSFGPVAHVVLTLGLSFRVGHIELAPETRRPEPTRVAPVTRPRPPTRDTARTDTTRTDTARMDTVRSDSIAPDTIVIRGPLLPPPDTTVRPDTSAPGGGLRPQEPDTVRTPRRPDTVAVRPPPDTIGPPTDTVRGPVVTRPPVDTTAGPGELPTDTVDRPPLPPGHDSVARPPRPPVRPPVQPPPDSGPGGPPDTVDVPTDTTGADDPEGPAPGRLFAVRVAWDPGDPVQETAFDALSAVLARAGVPVWAAEPGEDDDPTLEYRRVAALRDAAHARTLANHIEAEYGLAAEWVHIGRDEEIPADVITAGMQFVEGLSQGPGESGRGGGEPGGGGTSARGGPGGGAPGGGSG